MLLSPDGTCVRVMLVLRVHFTSFYKNLNIHIIHIYNYIINTLLLLGNYNLLMSYLLLFKE